MKKFIANNLRRIANKIDVQEKVRSFDETFPRTRKIIKNEDGSWEMEKPAFLGA